MSRPTFVYGILLLVCAGGLWGILHAGSHLSAVADLSGEWEIQGGPLGPGGVSPEQLGNSFTIDQSGRFFHIKFSRDRVLDLKATSIEMGSIEKPIQLTLANSENQLSGTVRPNAGALEGEFVLTGPGSAKFLARRAPKTPAGKSAGNH